MRKLFFTLSIMVLGIILAPMSVTAQVTIGSGDAPNSFSVLELSTKHTHGGLRLPQLTIEQRNALGFTSATNTLANQGLMIYNTDIKCIEYWDNVEWISLCTGDQIAQIELGNCTAASVQGVYQVGKALDATNSYGLSIKATAKGLYGIEITTNNGYSFRASGNIQTLGDQTIIVPGTGMPTAASAGDVVSVKFNGQALPTLGGCTLPTIPVVQIANIQLANCSNSRANGTYQAGKALDGTNTYALAINALSIGTYTLQVNTTNGYSFTKTGTITAISGQTITLPGTGMPLAESSGDVVSVKLNGQALPIPGGCTLPTIPVAAQVANITLTNCSNSKANGYYQINVPLDQSNTYSLNINAATVGKYTLEVKTTNGYSFSASGTITSTGDQTITLAGSGTPIAIQTDNASVYLNGNVLNNCTLPIINVIKEGVVVTLDCSSAAYYGPTPVIGQPMPQGSGIGGIRYTILKSSPQSVFFTTNSPNGVTFQTNGGQIYSSGTITGLNSSGAPIGHGTIPFIVSVNGAAQSNTCTFNMTF